MRNPRLIPFTTIVAPMFALMAACDEQPASPEITPFEETIDAAFDVGPLQGPSIPFADLEIFFEFNATDNDLGLQVFLDAVGWSLVSAASPDDRNLFQILARNELGSLGITELRFESAEPSPAGVLRKFPPGTYDFIGRPVEGGGVLRGSDVLSHVLAPAPVMTPEDDEEVDPENTVIAWQPIAGLARIEVIVANEDNGRSMTVELGPDATSLSVPVEFMESGAEYKAEVLAILPNGNKTISETTFFTK
ncbi:MAG: hypothetical protein L0271_15830 [Gemmatimonadetes bacterium]|nr:hypothetical protein [Gemmatimonadota bacterium]